MALQRPTVMNGADGILVCRYARFEPPSQDLMLHLCTGSEVARQSSTHGVAGGMERRGAGMPKGKEG